jgi:lipid-binding SYLF domain-containing protein
MLCDTHGKENKATRSKMFPLLMFALAFLLALPALGADQYKDEETLRDAAHVLDQMFQSKSIPPDLFTKAECVIVMPNVKKFGIGIGGTGGRGPMSCRGGANFHGKWSPPAMYSIGGASAGLQIGGSSSDLVLLIMDQKGLDAILKGKTKLGTDATAAAGPGATAAGTPGGDILTYAHSKGLFAGVSLGGASIDADNDANKRLYGQPVAAQDIVRGTAVKTTDAGQPLISLLDTKVGK